MSGSASWAVQQAMYTRLHGDATLVATAQVYDDVPENAAFPYVTISEFTEVADDTMGKTGRDVTATVHGWSRYLGNKEVEGTVMDRVDVLLDRWLPTLSGWSATQMLQEFKESFRDDSEGDLPLRHSVARYRIHVYAP